MQELIDRQALIADYRICGGCSSFENCSGHITMCDSARVRQAINEAPKVKARPEWYGQWVVNDRNPDYADCTNCGLSEYLAANGSRAYAETLLPGFKKYCPNCGARMKKEA